MVDRRLPRPCGPRNDRNEEAGAAMGRATNGRPCGGWSGAGRCFWFRCKEFEPSHTQVNMGGRGREKTLWSAGESTLPQSRLKPCQPPLGWGHGRKSVAAVVGPRNDRNGEAGAAMGGRPMGGLLGGGAGGRALLLAGADGREAALRRVERGRALFLTRLCLIVFFTSRTM